MNKTVCILIILALTICYKTKAQSLSFADNIFKDAVKYNEGGIFWQMRKDKVYDLVLLDTFKLFTPKLTFKSGKITITVVDKHPGNRENFVSLYNVWTEDSVFVVAFMQPYSGHATRFYFSTYGKYSRLVKVKSGDF